MLENFQGDSWGLIPPLRMPSLLPHDLCHGRSASRWLPEVIEFQLSYSRSWKIMLWRCCTQYAICHQYAICQLPASPPFLFLKTARCSSAASFWMFCRRILTIQGRMIMRSKIRTKDIRQNVFSWNEVRESVKKVISCPSGSKIQSRVFQGLYLIMKFS